MELTNTQAKYIQHLKEKGVEVSLANIEKAESLSDILTKIDYNCYYIWLVRTNCGQLPITESEYFSTEGEYFTSDRYLDYVASFGNDELTDKLSKIISENSDTHYIYNNFDIGCDSDEFPLDYYKWNKKLRLSFLVD
jgi:hypothetical protein